MPTRLMQVCSREAVTSLCCHKRLISLVMLDCQRQPLKCTHARRRKIWERSDHTLRKRPSINWGKDRGKNPPGSPWGEERINDRHLTLAEKQAVQ